MVLRISQKIFIICECMYEKKLLKVAFEQIISLFLLKNRKNMRNERPESYKLIDSVCFYKFFSFALHKHIHRNYYFYEFSISNRMFVIFSL